MPFSLSAPYRSASSSIGNVVIALIFQLLSLFLAATTIASFSLLAPYRPASSSTSSVTIVGHLFIVRCLSSLPPTTDFPTSTTPQQLLQPPYCHKPLPSRSLLPLLLATFTASIHCSLTLLFIARCSSIGARTVLSTSPSNSLVVAISNLLSHSSSTPLRLLYCQRFVSASLALWQSSSSVHRRSRLPLFPPPQAISPMSLVPRLSFPCFNTNSFGHV
ncbi:hypothetical protein GW17_00053977 [Ensete ventricosum]|nr:hypothetical protein GW17_00053977 [Ensete ventricosum]RZR93431.1 hypothetical protein BHM03_00021938 [Ensete ventricosum]